MAVYTPVPYRQALSHTSYISRLGCPGHPRSLELTWSCRDEEQRSGRRGGAVELDVVV